MLKINAIVRPARTESTEGNTLKTPAYRAPRVIEVGKASNLLQGSYLIGYYRDCTNSSYAFTWRH